MRPELWAAAAAGCAVLVGGTASCRQRLHGVLGAGRNVSSSEVAGHTQEHQVEQKAPWWTSSVFAASCAAAALVLVGIAMRSAAAGAVAAAVSVGMVAARRRGWADRLAAARRQAVMELCAGMAAELRAGRTPGEALRAAAESQHSRQLVGPAIAGMQVGGDVAAALVASSRLPGALALRRVAACWSVAADSGAGLAAGVERLAESLRVEESVRREMAAQIAGPRMTARMLAALPVLPLAMASSVGGRPLEVLLHTPWGHVCLAVGGAFIVAGLLWSERLVRSAERRI